MTEKTLFEKLSSQQLAILTLIAQGKSTPQIAASLLTTEKNCQL
ncbi:LuxR C-terminal-related transcriptional regulator [Secundilactobacillus collinoides]